MTLTATTGALALGAQKVLELSQASAAAHWEDGPDAGSGERQIEAARARAAADAAERSQWYHGSPQSSGEQDELVQVWAHYENKTGKLVIMDEDTGEFTELSATSGGKPYGDPIPPGKYEILERQNAKIPEFRLDAIDDHPRNDINDTADRSRLRLHGPGHTVGCIACLNGPAWKTAYDLINGTSTYEVYDASTYHFWQKPTGAPLLKYGTLTVE